jgi:aspartyl protease family protein
VDRVNGFDGINGLWLIGALMLAISALSVRSMSLGMLVRSLLSWALIVLVAVLAVAHRHEIGALFASATAQLGIDDQQVDGKTVRIRMSPDGHFWARVTLNGVEKRMLIDSGATITAISQETADTAGIEASRMPVMIETANGTVAARRGTIQQLGIGPLATDDLGVVISANFGDLDVLGMNFLSRLHSWRVENNVLVLEPKAGAADEGSEVTTSPPRGERQRPRRARDRDADTDRDFT